MEVDDAGEVGRWQVGEHGQCRQRDDPTRSDGAASQRHDRTEPEDRLEDDEGDRDGRHHVVPVPGGQVDLIEVVRSRLAGGRAVIGPFEAPTLHRRRTLHAGEVEDRRRDVDQRHQAGAAGAPRSQQAGVDARGVHRCDREVDVGGSVVRPDHQHRVALEIDGGEQPGDERIRVPQGLPSERDAVLGGGHREVAIDSSEVGRLDQHHAARGPRLIEGRRDGIRRVVDAEGSARIRLEQARADRATGHRALAVDEGDGGGAAVRGPFHQAGAIGVGDDGARDVRVGERLAEGADLGAVVEPTVAAAQRGEPEGEEPRVAGVTGVAREDRPCRGAEEVLGGFEHLATGEHPAGPRARAQGGVAVAGIGLGEDVAHRQRTDGRAIEELVQCRRVPAVQLAPFEGGDGQHQHAGRGQLAGADGSGGADRQADQHERQARGAANDHPGPVARRWTVGPRDGTAPRRRSPAR